MLTVAGGSNEIGAICRLRPSSVAADLGSYAPPHHRVLEFARLAVRNGWNMADLTTRSGLRPRAGADAERFNATVAMTRMLELLADRTNDDLLGLGRHPVPRGTFRVLAFAMISAADLGSAISRIEDLASCFPGLPALEMSRVGGGVSLSVQIDQGLRNPLVSDAFLILAYLTLNWSVRHPVPLRRIDIPHSVPRGETDYHLIFGATPLAFDTDRPCLVLDSTALAMPIMRDSQDVDELFGSGLSGLLDEFESCLSHAARVRRLIQDNIGRRPVSATDIAIAMRMSRQTLRRRLLEESTSVSKIRDEVLRDAAITSLSQTGQTATAIAEQLGFSEPSAFTRAFRRWTGVSPILYRQS